MMNEDKLVARATAAEMALAATWAAETLGDSPTSGLPATGRLFAAKQGYGRCMRGRSIETPEMSIGSVTFTRGLATHVESEIRIELPAPGARLLAEIGRDQNRNVLTYHSEITFVVEAEGCELFHSDVFHGGEEPFPIDVPLHGATACTLRVTGLFDGGHGDWANARVLLENGEEVWLDELPSAGLMPVPAQTPPLSFIYGGQASAELLASWTRETHVTPLDAQRTQHQISYTDPVTGLRVTWETITYTDYPATEWVVYFENTGTADTPILENIQALDMRYTYPAAEGDLLLHSATGSICTTDDFAPLTEKLAANSEKTLAPSGGRSSSGPMPYFNIEIGGTGIIFAIGWTGQWAAKFVRDEANGLHLQAGMERTHLILHPGERIRTPRIAMYFWSGGTTHAHNAWRQFILDHHTPRQHGKRVQTPITISSWGMTPVEEHLKNIDQLAEHQVPFDYYWIDAGWYGDCKVMSDWYPQAGNWYINRTFYPDGMKPISDKLHALGKGFLLWVDTERACRDTQIFREHPEWVLTLPNENSNLLNLGHPEARQYMTDLISRLVTEEGVDLYRQDSNIDTLPFWQAADAPDRQGMAEIRHIEGLYAFLDELLARHPHLIIDNCSSGGRRLDLEMTSRSLPLWRSDLQCSPDYSAIGSQAQTLGLLPWLPYHSAGCNFPGDTYDCRSAIASGLVGCWSLWTATTPDFPWQWARRMMEEMTRLRPYFDGDFYPITSYSRSSEVWMAYQLDRPDLGEGVILAYRREESPYPQAVLTLQNLEADARYTLRNWDSGDVSEHTGAELMEQGFALTIGERRATAILQYEKITL